MTELSRLRVGDGPIPTLESLLSLVDGQVPLLLEVKVDERHLALDARAEAGAWRVSGPFGVMSFDPRVPRLLKTNVPRVRRGLVIKDSLSPVRREHGAVAGRSPFHCRGSDCARKIMGRSRARADAGLQLDDRGPRATHASAGSCRRRSSGKPMADREAEVVAKLSSGVSGLNAAAWDRLAGRRPLRQPCLPVRAGRSREASARAPAGRPRPILIEDDASHLTSAAPAYLKTHSQGEYVFDHGWADAFERAGGAYYPKLQIAVPFTPVPGPRLLGSQPQHLLAAAEAVVVQNEILVGARRLSSTRRAPRKCERRGWLIRHGIQYHWETAATATSTTS